MQRDHFLRILQQCLHQPGAPPWQSLPPPAAGVGVSLLLFVHRVADTDPGIYFLARNPNHAKVLRLRRQPFSDYAWSLVPACPEGLELYKLKAGHTEELAARVSCHQGIAGEGVHAAHGCAAALSTLLDGPKLYILAACRDAEIQVRAFIASRSFECLEDDVGGM